MNKFRILIIFLIVLLFLLSGCYSVKEVGEIKEKLDLEWSEKYDQLQEEYEQLQGKYDSLSSELESVYDDILKTDDEMSTLYLYFEENSISYDEAYDAYDSLSTKLIKYY